MLLAVDIGNTDITTGVWLHNAWDHVWRVPTSANHPEVYYGLFLQENFLEAGLSVHSVDRVVLSSVVPGITEKIRTVLAALFHHEVVLLGPALYTSLPIKINNPFEIGSDLVANAVAANEQLGDCIIVDFGTALTFTTVYRHEIAGVAIVPGLKTAIKSLSQNAAKLYEVPLQVPQSVLGTNTIDAIQAGIIIGYEGLVKNVVSKTREELNAELVVVATGGLSSIITTLSDTFDVLNPHLTLDGLRIIAFSKQENSL